MPSIFAATCREKGKRESRKAFFHSSTKKELLEREKVLTTAFSVLTCSSYVYIFLLYITTNTTKFQMTVKERKPKSRFRANRSFGGGAAKNERIQVQGKASRLK
jgi:hypothetical protein